MTVSSSCRLLLLLLLVLVLCVVWMSATSHHVPEWQQYYPYRRWAFHDEQIHGRPPRVRVGRGRFRLLPVGAELNCEFPPHLRLVSNVVWERADLGDRSSLNQIYRAFGLPHEFSVHTHPHGSTLHIFHLSSLDRGLYRCLVSAVDTGTLHGRQLSAFQDIEFYPLL